MANVSEAIEWAVRLHSGERREGDAPLPYATHPIEVLLNLRYIGQVIDEEMWCAAALHDTVEAGHTTLENIRAKFGTRVTSLVEELTRTEPTAEQVSGLTKQEIWKLRAEMLIEEVAHMSADAQQIKLADRLANLQDAFRTKSGKKLERYKWQTREILKVVSQKTNKGLWNRISKLSEGSEEPA